MKHSKMSATVTLIVHQMALFVENMNKLPLETNLKNKRKRI